MKVSLTKWARQNFDPAPGINTLRQWARSGQIVPAPIKVGRQWMVDDFAEYYPLTPSTEGASDNVRRILNATATQRQG